MPWLFNARKANNVSAYVSKVSIISSAECGSDLTRRRREFYPRTCCKPTVNDAEHPSCKSSGRRCLRVKEWNTLTRKNIPVHIIYRHVDIVEIQPAHVVDGRSRGV